jgi:hypothetical protein
MSSFDKVTAQASAGLLAAASAVVGKRGRRLAWPGVPPRGLRVASAPDTPHLFEGTHDSPKREHKLARIAAASLLYAYEKKVGGHAERVLAPGERDVIRRVHEERVREPRKKDIRCRYCHLSSALYKHVFHVGGEGNQGSTTPKFVVVRHSATVNADFDPNTFVSKASIDNYQVLLPEKFARQLVERTNPLNWHDAAPTLFLAAGPAKYINGEWQEDLHKTRQQWEKEATETEAFLFERVASALNTNAVTEIENSIRISDFKKGTTTVSLSYKYDLQSCIDSDFAIVREPGGLDLDFGESNCRACPPKDIKEEDLWGITQRDLDQLNMNPSDDQLVDDNAPSDPPLPKDALPGAVERVRARAAELGGSQNPWWLVTVTASKALRFTAPGNTPLDLWATLTYLGPALVFNFVNGAVCQAAADLTSQPQPGTSPQNSGVAQTPAPAPPSPHGGGIFRPSGVWTKGSTTPRKERTTRPKRRIG